MKRLILGGIGLVAVGLVVWIALKPTDWQTWLGFSRKDYFQYGTNYAFASGPGPMILTALGMGTIITGLWHTHNCHHDGCWNIGRHKINGTPWCNVHEAEGRELVTVERLIEAQNLLLQEQNDLLRQVLAKAA